MRLCRYVKENQMQICFYEETHVIDMAWAFEQLLQSTPLENHEEDPTLLSFSPQTDHWQSKRVNSFHF